MRSQPTPVGPQGEVHLGLDPELVALGAPPQTQRALAIVVMVAALVAAAAMVVSLRADVGYSLASGRAVDLGDVRALRRSDLVSNTYVRIEGLPTIGQAARFSQGLGGTFRVFPLAGQRTVYVQVEDRGGESFVRSKFTGRLVTFGDLGGRYAELVRAMQRELELPVTSESFLLLADVPPSSYVWTWFVCAMCTGFLLLDAYFLWRWFRPVRIAP